MDTVMQTNSVSRAVCFCLCLTGLLLGSLLSDAHGKLVDRILAVVNGEVITRYEFEQYLKISSRFNEKIPEDLDMIDNEEIKLQILDQMINEILVEQEAQRFEIDVGPSDLEAYIERYKENNDLNDAAFAKELKKQGLSLEDYKEKISRDIKKNQVINTMIRQKVVVTEEEERKYYENNQDQFKQPKQVQLRLLLVSSRDLLLQLREDIVAGSISFAEAAREHSIGPGAEQGGDMGVLEWDDLGRDWKEALSGLEAGEVSDIFELRGHFALLYPQSINTENTVPFAEARDAIQQKLYTEKLNNRFHEYITQLRSKAVLDIKL